MGFTAQTRRSLLTISALVSLTVVAGLDITSPAPVLSKAVTQVTEATESRMLSGIDKARYRQAFMLQRSGRFAEADKELSLAENPLLKDTILAERYKSKKYKPSYEELAAWLNANNAAPAAEEIYRLAVARKGAGALKEPLYKTQKGLSNSYAKSARHDSKTWDAGLAAFKRNDMAQASFHFRALADAENLSQEDKAAAAFWAYRALKEEGDEKLATHYLDITADAPSGFYSLLARTLTGETQALANPPVASQQEMDALLTQTPIQRAIALKEIGENTLAEAELRLLYLNGDKAKRNGLLAIAKKLDIPALQMQIAGYNAEGKKSFPMPDWQPTSGYQVERALLFAIMRQESGFNPNARSSAGALGLMQLMPATASAMARQGRQLGSSLDPAVNITLGQRYLEHLMQLPHVGDNLIYITASYNAGPGAVASWLRKSGEQDPLLFVESIPYEQTREYVMHVVANYWVYSQLMGVHNPSSLQALAAGEWPRYEGAERQLVALLNKAD